MILRTSRILISGALLVGLLLGAGGGYWFATARGTQDAIITTVTGRDLRPTQAVDFALFWQVWDKLHEKYVSGDSLDAQKLVYGAIRGMVEASGDPYTTFMEPITNTKFQEEVNGAFSGVGMEVGKRDGVITVIAPIRNSPAMRAGVLAGDIIVKVDGKDTSTWSAEEAVTHIRGKKGTSVALTIARKSETEFIELTIVRDVIKIPAVEWKLLPNAVAYIQVISFNGNVADEFATALREASAQHATQIVLDLRGNPGGLLDEAATMAGYLLSKGDVVVQEKFRDGSVESMRADGNAAYATTPIIVLIDGGSASASEILAGALHDNRDVRLVGSASFGKGSVQQLEQFYNGSALKVTIAKWLTPNGISISDQGISPTDEVSMEPALYKEKGWEVGVPGKDPQLDKALELLTK